VVELQKNKCGGRTPKALELRCRRGVLLPTERGVQGREEAREGSRSSSPERRGVGYEEGRRIPSHGRITGVWGLCGCLQKKFQKLNVDIACFSAFCKTKWSHLQCRDGTIRHYNFEFQKDRMKHVGAVGVEISPLPLKRHIAYTTACCHRTSRDLSFLPEQLTLS